MAAPEGRTKDVKNAANRMEAQVGRLFFIVESNRWESISRGLPSRAANDFAEF
jgi:hypothetical protein